MGAEGDVTIVLVAMPWCSLFNPSIQTGILAAVAGHAGHRAAQRAYNMAFADFLAGRAASAGRSFDAQSYMHIGIDFAMHGLGDWIFAVPPFRERERERDDVYLQSLRAAGAADETLALAAWVREQVPDFLDQCVDDLLDLAPRVVGCTTGFSQTVASLALCQRLKARASEVFTVLGGADCDGPMGEGIIRAFPAVDAVVRGEGEPVLPRLLDDVVRRGVIAAQPGLCWRDAGEVFVERRGAGAKVAMDEVPTPDYDEFFARLMASPLRKQIAPAVEITVESSRGCWWGQKHHCTFCGYNGDEMAYRRKSPERVVGELAALAARHRTHGFLMTDAILDPSYFTTVLPRLADSGFDLRIFYEIKANLTRAQVEGLRAAGVVHVQPGIESLSTPILKHMRKGATALQNIRLLKWCRELGINALWNIIYGFPGEDPAAYAEMAALVRSLSHLQPPSLVRLVLDRFSPYQLDPAAFGLEITGPPDYYDAVFPDDPAVRAEWMHIAYRFEYRHLDGRDPETYVGPLRAAVERWRADHRPERVALRYLRGPGFVTIVDERPGLRRGRYVLEDMSAEIYLACDAGATLEQISRHVAGRTGAAPDPAALVDTLAELSELRLLHAEGERWLSLAIPARRRYPDAFSEA